MTARSIVQLLAQADVTIEDNSTGAISAADVRNMIKDFLDTIAPAYGVIQCASVVESLVVTPAQLIAPFTSVAEQTTPQFAVNLTNGSVTRTLGGIAGATCRITIDGAVEGGNNNDVTVRLFVNGVASSGQLSVSTRGAGNPVAFNLSALTYNAVDAIFDVRATTDTPGSFTFTNVLLLCENVPVRNF